MVSISNGVADFITTMTKKDAMAPIIALESTVTLGRTLQAYKRGGADEARERFIEEGTGAIVWLGGVKALNALGDKILEKKFGKNFDVGTDKILRTPFKNFLKNSSNIGLSPKNIALIKAAKVLASVILADTFIGLVVPPLNQKLTKKLRKKDESKKQQKLQQDKLELSQKQQKTPSFKGGLSALNAFTNAIENTNTGKLLSTDAGLVSGRMYSARNNDERREIAIRDIGSIYFYMWAQNHVGNVLNFIESGKWSRLDPNTAVLLDEHLREILASKGGSMSVEEFKKAVLGNKNIDLSKLNSITFEKGELSFFENLLNKIKTTKIEPLQVAKVSDIEKEFLNEPKLLERIRAMSKLQPLRQGEAVITKQQIIDAMNECKINDPKFLDKVFSAFTNKASKDELKFVSNKSLYDLKGLMEDYIEALCKDAKDGNITEDIIKKAKSKNMAFNTINFISGFVFAAVFLSTLIPKFQYWVTKQKTGRDGFPGLYEEQEKNNV